MFYLSFHEKKQAYSSMAPGDLDSIHDILPPPRYILTSRELTKHHLTSLVRHIIPAGIVLVCCLVVHCMQYLHVLAVQRSLTVVRPSQAFHVQYVSIRVTFAIFSIVAYRTCTEIGSRRSIIDTSRRHQVMVSLKDFRCHGIHRCGRCPLSIDIYILPRFKRVPAAYMGGFGGARRS